MNSCSAVQVLKKRLAMNEPTVMCGGFGYEEGADLEPDEVEANQKLLPIMLDQLPAGGIKHGAILSISDQAQDFSCQIVVSHKVEAQLKHQFPNTQALGVVERLKQSNKLVELQMAQVLLFSTVDSQ